MMGINDGENLGGEMENEEMTENTQLVLFQAKDCYVYLIPPRKSTASYRADEWNINKWNWEGVLKVVSKGEECTIRLEDSVTGELYAQAPVRADQPLPIEAVIDSSRFFVLRIEDNSGSQARHAFIGIGFRDRVPAYDFQAAVYDHIKYLNKKKQAEELVHEYESRPTVDYSLKDGQTLRLNIKSSSVSSSRSKFFDQNMDSLQRTQTSTSGPPVPFLAPPPNPTVPLTLLRAPSNTSNDTSTDFASCANSTTEVDDDFGDFQTAC